MSKVLFACSKGAESAEFSVPYDILKRAGADLTIAKVPENDKDTEKCFETAHGLKIMADKTIEEVKNNTYDMIVCPGGLPNAQILGKNKTFSLLFSTTGTTKYINLLSNSFFSNS